MDTILYTFCPFSNNPAGRLRLPCRGFSPPFFSLNLLCVPSYSAPSARNKVKNKSLKDFCSFNMLILEKYYQFGKMSTPFNELTTPFVRIG